MRRADGEPERRAGRLLVPLVVVGAAVVVLSTAAEGRAVFTPLGGAAPAPGQPSPPSLPSAAPPRTAPDSTDLTVSSVLSTVLTVLALLVLAVIAVVLIRLIVDAIRTRRRRGAAARIEGLGAEAGPEVADAPTVLRGIAAALVAIDEQEREPSDAIVRAWLGLQQAAEDAGFARSAAETPTEFTGRVLSRTGADRAALGTLLRLYLRARFGDGTITAGDTTDAREALRALEASWQRPVAAGTGSGTEPRG